MPHPNIHVDVFVNVRLAQVAKVLDEEQAAAFIEGLGAVVAVVSAPPDAAGKG